MHWGQPTMISGTACRLLGFEAGRSRCWLYRIEDRRFVARWETARLQVLGTTPAAALAGLRRCATTYQHICGVELPFPASTPISRPKPMAAQLAAEYELFVDCVKARDGFWRDAKALSETACRYRGALAWADQVRQEHLSARHEDCWMSHRIASGWCGRMDLRCNAR